MQIHAADTVPHNEISSYLWWYTPLHLNIQLFKMEGQENNFQISSNWLVIEEKTEEMKKQILSKINAIKKPKLSVQA